MAKVLEVNRSLEVVDWSDNSITLDGGTKLAEAFFQNRGTALKKLVLEGNRMSAAGPFVSGFTLYK